MNYPYYFILIIYADDTIKSGSDATEIHATKHWVQSLLLIKDCGKLQYFLGIVVSRNWNGILSNTSKYVSILLEETDYKYLRATDTPLEVPIMETTCIVEKLIYITVMR